MITLKTIVVAVLSISLWLFFISIAYAEDEGLDIQNGVLHGATGITVYGQEGTYDVEFLGGTCPSVYSPCIGTDNFQFNSVSGVEAASDALMTLFDDMDDDGFQPGKTPSLVNGCEETSCAIMTPAYTKPIGPPTYVIEEVLVGVYINHGSVRGGDDYVYTDEQSSTYDITDEEWATWARWTLSPVVVEDCCNAGCHP
jgi:hypothetical protein